jgi:hypothetical protein
MKDMPTAKTWGMLLDQEIISHLENKDYLGQLVQVLMGKIEHIMVLSRNPAAKAEILNDERVKAFLSGNW